MVVKYQITNMEDIEKQDINLDEMTNEELEALLEDDAPEPKEDTSVEIEKLKQRNAMLQRLLNKKSKQTQPAKQVEITKDNELTKDIEEIKFYRKVETFAEDNGLSKKQAEQVLKLYPNATAETLNDPFVKAGIEALAKKERVAENTPRGNNAKSVTMTKKYSEMTADEKKQWYSSRVSK